MSLPLAAVADADVRSSVWFLRGLVRAGIRTLALSHQRPSAGFRVRGIVRNVTTPDPARDPAGFVATLEAAAAGRELIVYPGREESLTALLDHPPAAPVRLPYPDSRATALVRDKAWLEAHAAGAGLRTPTTVYAGPAGEARAETGAPLLVKPMDKGTALTVVHRVAGGHELERLMATLPADEPVIVQELVAGPLTALILLVDGEGRAIVRFQQRARRTWPRAGGPSAEAVSEPLDEELAERTLALLRGAGYSGLAEVQFVGGRIIDVNPRPYGSISLPMAAGVDLPALWHRMAAGERLEPHPGYVEGVTYRWLEADVYAALRGDVRALARRTPQPAVGAFWDRRDPMSGIVLAAESAAGFGGRRVQRVAQLLRSSTAP